MPDWVFDIGYRPSWRYEPEEHDRYQQRRDWLLADALANPGRGFLDPHTRGYTQAWRTEWRRRRPELVPEGAA